MGCTTDVVFSRTPPCTKPDKSKMGCLLANGHGGISNGRILRWCGSIGSVPMTKKRVCYWVGLNGTNDKLVPRRCCGTEPVVDSIRFVVEYLVGSLLRSDLGNFF